MVIKHIAEMPLVTNKISQTTDTLVMGAGLAGLTVAHQLVKSNHRVIAIEKNKHVGGLARTIKEGDFRYDVGGHRFITQDKAVDDFVKSILEGDYLVVPRSSKILLNNQYFQYPLKPINSIFGLGVKQSIKIILDYAYQRLKNQLLNKQPRCLEDWVVQQFGKTMFELYFKEYSEKVWGIDCKHIAKEWIAQRIQGLSLGAAIKDAISNKKDYQYTTLVDNFIYPHLGIGALADNLSKNIVGENKVLTQSSVIRLNHSNNKIGNAVIKQGNKSKIIEAQEFVSSIPITTVVNALYPQAPKKILDTAAKLRYRDLLLVTIMLNQERVTDQTWIYFPDKKIPFGRIHEPTNWSAKMAPAGKTLLVAEYFCFQNDEIWSSDDKQLAEMTAKQLHDLNLINKQNVIDFKVLRIPKAYPLFENGFQANCTAIYEYLDQFENLSMTGRTGKFKYYNMDHTIGSGIDVAQKIINKYPEKCIKQDKNLTRDGTNS